MEKLIMDDIIKQNIELLSELGYEYDESKNGLYCTGNDLYIQIPLQELGDIVNTFKRLFSIEKEISFWQGEEYAKSKIRHTLGLEP